jgi:predicted Zn-dependent peptidase
MIEFLKDTFKTYTIQYHISHTYDPKYYVHSRVFSQLVLNSSQKYPNRKRFHEAMETLYGVIFNGYNQVNGNQALMRFEIKAIHGQFVSESNLLKDTVNLCLDALIHPNFDQSIFDEEVYGMLQQLYAIKENKRGYASYRFKHTLDSTKTLGMSLEEQLDVLKTLTLEDIKSYYEAYIKNANRIVCGTGPFLDSDILYLKDVFKPIVKPPIKLSYDPISFKRLEPLKEYVDMNQKMIYQAYHVGILPQDELYYSMLIYNEILGSSADSRLFRDIREKRGLCYQVYAGYNPFDTTLTVYAGIDIEKETLTLDAIKDVMDSMQEITDEELEFAKKSLIHQVTSALDQQTYPLERLTRTHFYGYSLTHQERLINIHSVTHQSLKHVHEKLKYMYTYILTGESHA